jgi:hypothetical protein
MEIATHGIMRGGIHVVHGWIISKCDDESVVYYNNIRDPTSLEDRYVSPQDTRVEFIRDKLISPTTIIPAQLVLKSFESKLLDLYTSSNANHLIIVRNPYNNLASSIAYLQHGGSCEDIFIDERFEQVWKKHVRECLGLTSYLPRKVVIVYDLFIADINYRRLKSIQLTLPPETDKIGTLQMGGGSSFNHHSHSHYLNRFLEYEDHPSMKRLLSDSEVTSLWELILTQEINFLRTINPHEDRVDK